MFESVKLQLVAKLYQLFRLSLPFSIVDVDIGIITCNFGDRALGPIEWPIQTVLSKCIPNESYITIKKVKIEK